MLINHRYVSKLFAFIVICFIFYSELSFAEGVKNWIQWRDGYLTQAEGIEAEAVKEARRVSNWSNHEGAILVIRDSQEKAIKELGALKVPAELQEYHQKLIEGHNFMIKSADAYLSGDAQAAQNFGLKAAECEKESYKELRRVAEQHGAPKEDLDTIDKVSK
jgi:hypothetical protein